MSVVDLDLLTRQVIQTYPQLHGPEVEIKIDGFLPKVFGHPAAISQGISNLLTNAVKFVAAGTKPVVIVRAEQLPKSVRLWVIDNGIGIDAKNHKRIFGMFERVSNDYEGQGSDWRLFARALNEWRERPGWNRRLDRVANFGSNFVKSSDGIAKSRTGNNFAHLNRVIHPIATRMGISDVTLFQVSSA